MLKRDRGIPLGLLLAIKANTGPNLAFAATTIAAIAIAVAFAVALELSSRAIRVDLDQTANAIAGDAEIEIVAGDVGVPEWMLEEVRAVPGVAAAEPSIEATFRLEDGSAIRVIGLDFAAERPLKEYSVERDGVRIRDPLRLLARVESIIVSERLASRIGLNLGDVLPARSGGRTIRFTVEGLLRDGGLGSAFGGQIAVMDVFNLQAVTRRTGWFDRIDVASTREATPGELLDQLETEFGDTATVRSAAVRRSLIADAATAVRWITWILAAVGAIAAAFLCYATISLAAARRAREFFLLRSIGLEPGTIRTTVWIESGATAFVGILAGLSLGLFVARVLTDAAASMPDLLGTSVDLRRAGISLTTLVAAAGVGLCASVAGAWQAAADSERRAGEPEFFRPIATATRGHRRLFLGGLALAVVLAFALPLHPAVRAVVALAGCIFGLLLASPYLPALLEAARPVLSLIPRLGSLLGTGLIARARTVGLATATVVVIMTAVVVVLTITASFRESLLEWSASRYPGSLRITAGTPFAPVDRDPVALETIEAIRSSPHVEDLAEFHSTEVLFRGTPINLIATPIVTRKGRSWLEPDRGPSCSPETVSLGGVAVSEAFSAYFGVAYGDAIAIATPAGLRDFTIACVFRSFEGRTGSLMIDLALFDSLWIRSGATLVAVWANGDPEALVEDVRIRAGGEQDLFFTDATSIRQNIGAVVGRFERAFRLVALLALLLGCGALTNCLVGIANERWRELAVLKSVGAGPGLIAGLVFGDGLLVTLTGAAIAFPLGLLLAHPVRDLLREALGWSLIIHVDPKTFLALVLGLLPIVGLSTLYPAVRSLEASGSEVYAPQ